MTDAIMQYDTTTTTAAKVSSSNNNCAATLLYSIHYPTIHSYTQCCLLLDVSWLR